MDYIIFSVLRNVTLRKVVLTYDIACQWSKNFQSRQDELPEHLRLNPNMEIAVAIPGGTSTDMGKHAKTISASATWMASGELAARMLKQAGLTQMPSGRAFVRWGQAHGTKRSTITGAVGIFTKSSDFISV
jgi:hypothetical protein